jgi:hypothetical protein
VKKFAASILILLYFIASAGAPVHIHYCMGKIISLEFGYSSATDKCPNCGMHQKKGCCEDKQTTIKVSEKYKPAINLSLNPGLSIFVTQIFLEDKKITNLQSVKYLPISLSRRKSNTLYKLHCVFLI